MKDFRLAFCALAVFVGHNLVVYPAAAETKILTAAQIQQLRNGDALVHVGPTTEGSARRVMATIDIPTSPGRLWTTMLDCTNASKFVSGLKSCRILDRDVEGRWDVREHVIQWTWLFPQIRSTFRSEYLHNQRILFRRIGGDLEKLEGKWILEPLDGGRKTRLHYMALVDAGVVLPGVVIKAAIKRDIPKTLKALRREAVAKKYN